MVMLRENQLCLETWLDDLSEVIPVADELADHCGNGRRETCPSSSRKRTCSLKAAAERMGATPREFAEHALESAIVAMEELDD